MKKIFAIGIVMFGVTFAAKADNLFTVFGEFVGELALAPVEGVVGAVKGVVIESNECSDYIQGKSTTTITKTTYTSAPPVYVIPSQPKEKHTVNISDSENVTVNITEVNSNTTTTRTPTVIYVPSTRPTYYYYNPYQFRFP